MRRLRPALALLALVLLVSAPAEARRRKKNKDRRDTPVSDTDSGKKGAFDYYVLSLSWSPAFCADNGNKSPEQCGTGKHYGFVVHGLWPQNERGWPESCGREELPSDVADSMLDLMPSRKLIAHEWEKHGTCSGLGAREYFAKVRAAFGAVHLPGAFAAPKDGLGMDLEKIERSFTSANPGLSGEMISVQCKRYLSEVRICLDKDLKFRRCGSDTGDRCKGSTIVPPIR